MEDYKKVTAIGTVLIISIFSLINYLKVDDIRQILSENPNYQIIITEPLQNGRIEMLVRSIDPTIDYFKYRFEGIYLKAYSETNLIYKSEWALWNGTKRIVFRDTSTAKVEYNSTKTAVWITEKADYYLDSRHTNFVGTIIRTIYITPDFMKESAVLDTNYSGLRLQYLVFPSDENTGESIDMDYNQSFWGFDSFLLNWTHDAGNITTVYKRGYAYSPDRIWINFKRDVYKVDPTITIGKYKIYYAIANETYYGKSIGRKYESGLTYGNLPIVLKLNKNLVIQKSKIKSLLSYAQDKGKINLTNRYIEFAYNKTFLVSNWVSNITTSCWNTTSTNGTITLCNYTDNGYWNNYTDWKWDWKKVSELGSTISLVKNKIYLINIHGDWKPELGKRAIDVIPSLNDYPMSELAWWNSSYDYRYAIINNQTTSAYVLAVNDTNEIESHIYWALVGNASYVYSTVSGPSGNIAIANETHEKDWENASSRIGNNPTNLWGALAYHFEEGSGSTAYDSSSDSKNGSITGASYVSADFGNGLNFDGLNDKVVISDSVSIDETFTIAYFIEVFTNANQQWNVFIDNYDGSTTNQLNHFYDDNNNIFRYRSGSGSAYQDYNIDLDDNGVHFIVVASESGNSSLWIDGEYKTYDSDTGNPDLSDSWRLGENSAGNYDINATIDEMWIYDDKKSDDWIKYMWDMYKNHLAELGAEETNISIPIDTLYSSVGANNTTPKVNDAVKFYSYWITQNGTLDDYIFSWNASGTWANDSAVSLGGNGTWSNITKSMANSYEGKTIGWRIYANNTPDNQWNETGINQIDVERTLMQIDLNSPADNYWSDSKTVTFTYTPTFALGISNMTIFTNETSWSEKAWNSSSVTNATTNTIDVTFSSNGAFIWTAGGYNENNFINLSNVNRTIYVDSTSPTYSGLLPTDNYWFDTTSATFNITPADNIGEVLNISLYTNETGNFIIEETTLVDNNTAHSFSHALSEGNYQWYIVIKDNATNTNQTPTRTVSVDITSPSWALDYPSNNTYHNSDFYFNWTLTELNRNTELWSNDSYATNYSFAYDWDDLVDVTVWGDGIKQVWVWGDDKAGNSGENMLNFTIDTIAPKVSITFPENTTYSNSTLYLNYTYSDVTSNIHTCLYNPNGIGNSTIAGCSNTTLTLAEMIDGLNNVTVWVNDSAGNFNSSTVYFTNNLEKATTWAFANASNFTWNGPTVGQDNNYMQPIGQGTYGIFNHTNNETITLDIQFKLSGSLNAGWTVWATDSSSSAGGIILNTTWQTVYDDWLATYINYTWLWANVTSAGSYNGMGTSIEFRTVIT